MTKSNKTIFAGLIMIAVLISSSVVYNTAFAQNLERERHLSDCPLNIGTILVGSGAAVSGDNHAWRSHFKMGIEEVQTVDNGHTEFEVKRGVFVIGNHDQRHVLSVMGDTWQVSVSPNDKSFEASGNVKNEDGKTYEIEISGDEISNLEYGKLYYVAGTATSSEGEVYNLFYISALIDRTSIETNGI